MNLRPYPHCGKYEGGLIIDEYVHEGHFDDEAGDVNEYGWYGLIEGPVVPTGEHNLNDDETSFLHGIAGAIVKEDGQGFVYVTYFDDAKKLGETWEKIVEASEEEI